MIALAKLLSRLPRGGFPVVRRLGIKNAVIATEVGPLHVDLTESVCYPLLKWGTYPHARDNHEWLRRRVGPNDLVFDVGANIGFTARMFAGLGARVIAFEPSPRAIRLLHANGEGVDIRQVALSDTAGTVRFSEDAALDTSHVAHTGIEVPAMTMDSLAERPTFIKIDVEGHEPAVLRGARETLRHGPTIFFEALTDDAARECFDIIKSANDRYRIERVGDSDYAAIAGA